MICSYVILFAICSFVGWIFESLLAIVKTRKWEARGFLYGPVCPIYGVGVVAIVLVAKAVLRYAGVDYTWWQIALVGFFGSMVLEYVTSWLLERFFHAYWWDYSDMPLNINGRTCIPAACLFSLGGLAAVYLISPAWDWAMAQVPFIVAEIAAYAIVVVFTVDATLTVSSLTKIAEQVSTACEAFHSRAGSAVDSLVVNTENAAGRISAETERWRDELLQGTVDRMSASVRATLSRIEGFRPPKAPAKPEFASDFTAFANRLLAKARRK